MPWKGSTGCGNAALVWNLRRSHLRMPIIMKLCSTIRLWAILASLKKLPSTWSAHRKRIYILSLITPSPLWCLCPFPNSFSHIMWILSLKKLSLMMELLLTPWLFKCMILQPFAPMLIAWSGTRKNQRSTSSDLEGSHSWCKGSSQMVFDWWLLLQESH